MGKDCDSTQERVGHRITEEVTDLALHSRLTVAIGDRLASVDLRKLAVIPIDGARYVCLADVWAASLLPGDLMDLAFDFVGDDGFRTTSKRPRVEGTLLTRGFVHSSMRDLVWDAALVVPCCYRVKRVAMIVATER